MFVSLTRAIRRWLNLSLAIAFKVFYFYFSVIWFDYSSSFYYSRYEFFSRALIFKITWLFACIFRVDG